MSSRRELLKWCGLGCLLPGVAAASACDLPVADKPALPLQRPFPVAYQPTPPRLPRVVLRAPPIVTVIAEPWSTRQAKVLDAAGRVINGVSSVKLVDAHQGEFRGAELTLYTFRVLPFMDTDEAANWTVTVIDGKLCCVGRDNRPVPGVEVKSWHGDAGGLARVVVACTCKVEWLEADPLDPLAGGR